MEETCFYSYWKNPDEWNFDEKSIDMDAKLSTEYTRKSKKSKNFTCKLIAYLFIFLSLNE